MRAAIVETARAMSAEGLSPGRSGNVSARVPGGVLITPTGLPYASMTPEQIVLVRDDGTSPRGALRPPPNCRCTARSTTPDRMRARSCTATPFMRRRWPALRKPIPAFHYMIAVAGGSDIPVAPYATFGSDELASNVAATLANRSACLLAHHGQIAFGADLAGALDLARDVEVLAAQYLKTLQIGGGPILSPAAMAEVAGKFAGYGQQTKPAGKTPK